MGNGRVILPLLKAGLDVHGFDASEDMLAHCRRACTKAGYSPRLWQDRFKTFEVEEGAFSAVIVPVGSFQLITDFQAAMRVLRRFRAALQSGGRLIVDLGTPGYFFQQAQRARFWRIDDEQMVTLVETPSGHDDVRQVAEWQLRYERWTRGRLSESEIDLFSLRWWGLEEFRLALEASGFREIGVHGDYERGTAPKSGHHTLTFEAEAA